MRSSLRSITSQRNERESLTPINLENTHIHRDKNWRVQGYFQAPVHNYRYGHGSTLSPGSLIGLFSMNGLKPGQSARVNWEVCLNHAWLRGLYLWTGWLLCTKLGSHIECGTTHSTANYRLVSLHTLYPHLIPQTNTRWPELIILVQEVERIIPGQRSDMASLIGFQLIYRTGNIISHRQRKALLSSWDQLWERQSSVIGIDQESIHGCECSAAQFPS